MVCRYGLVVALALGLFATTAQAEVSELKITKQPGLLFAPMLLMEHHKLIEKQAKEAGVPDFKASWLTVMSGGANNDALLSGSVHITTSGVTNMLLLWGKTNGDIKAIIGVSGLPFKLITRNANIKTIKDYTATDRIAVPTVRQSIQAITLGIALQKVYGDDKANEKLVPNQVQMGHPDALTAMLNPSHEVTSHFASSPFQEIELKQPGMHVVLESRDALGGDGHVSLAYGTTKFFQENCYYEEKPSRQEASRGTYDPEYLYYTLGKLQILELRREYQKQEGTAFTLKRFHDEMLRHGMPPIQLLRDVLLKPKRA